MTKERIYECILTDKNMYILFHEQAAFESGTKMSVRDSVSTGKRTEAKRNQEWVSRIVM